MTPDNMATRRYLASVASVRPIRPLDCSERERIDFTPGSPDYGRRVDAVEAPDDARDVLAATTADAVRHMQRQMRAMQEEIDTLRKQVKDLSHMVPA